MKIARIASLHADAGWRTFDYLKVTTDDGLVGWAEYSESFGGAGVAALIDRLAPALIGKDPRPYEAHVALLRGLRRASLTGAFAQAIGALENALIDLKARALGIPVYELSGGPIRERLPLYWSHCGCAGSKSILTCPAGKLPCRMPAARRESRRGGRAVPRLVAERSAGEMVS